MTILPSAIRGHGYRQEPIDLQPGGATISVTVPTDNPFEGDECVEIVTQASGGMAGPDPHMRSKRVAAKGMRAVGTRQLVRRGFLPGMGDGEEVGDEVEVGLYGTVRKARGNPEAKRVARPKQYVVQANRVHAGFLPGMGTDPNDMMAGDELEGLFGNIIKGPAKAFSQIGKLGGALKFKAPKLTSSFGAAGKVFHGLSKQKTGMPAIPSAQSLGLPTLTTEQMAIILANPSIGIPIVAAQIYAPDQVAQGSALLRGAYQAGTIAGTSLTPQAAAALQGLFGLGAEVAAGKNQKVIPRFQPSASVLARGKALFAPRNDQVAGLGVEDMSLKLDPSTGVVTRADTDAIVLQPPKPANQPSAPWITGADVANVFKGATDAAGTIIKATGDASGARKPTKVTNVTNVSTAPRNERSKLPWVLGGVGALVAVGLVGYLLLKSKKA